MRRWFNKNNGAGAVLTLNETRCLQKYTLKETMMRAKIHFKSYGQEPALLTGPAYPDQPIGPVPTVRDPLPMPRCSPRRYAPNGSTLNPFRGTSYRQHQGIGKKERHITLHVQGRPSPPPTLGPPPAPNEERRKEGRKEIKKKKKKSPFPLILSKIASFDFFPINSPSFLLHSMDSDWRAVFLLDFHVRNVTNRERQ